MSRPILLLAVLAFPSLAAAQSAPLVTTGKTAKTVGASEVNIGSSKPDGGGPANATLVAQNTLNSIRKFCDFTTREEKLVATCDDAASGARAAQLTPNDLPAWGTLARKIADAARTVNGKSRGVVVLNRAEFMAEVSAAGVLRLKN